MERKQQHRPPLQLILLLIAAAIGIAACDTAVPPPARSTPTTAADSPAAGATAGPNTETAQPSPAPAATATADRRAELRDLLSQSSLFAFIAPDGSLQLATPGGATLQLWQRGVSQLAWSPDGGQIAFVADGALYRWQAGPEAEPPQPLVEAVDPRYQPSWSADLASIAVVLGDQSRLVLVDPQSGATRALGSAASPHFAPQGQALLAISMPQGLEAGSSAPILWPTPDAAPIVLATAANSADRLRLAWSADGQLAAAGSVLLDSEGQIVERLGPPNSSEMSAGGISPDGRWVALAAPGGSDQRELHMFDAETGNSRAVWSSAGQEESGEFWPFSPVVWSPDGTLLAFSGSGSTLGSHPLQGRGIWVGTADGSELGPLPGSERAAGPPWTAPAFAPDRSQMLFIQLDDAGNEEIWGWEPGSGSQPRLIAQGSRPAWRP